MNKNRNKKPTDGQILQVRKRYAMENCSKAQLAKELGTTEYQINKILKDVTKWKQTVEERFWSKVRKGSPNECWEWLASKTSDGYGTFKYNGKTVSAHKFAYEITHGVCVPSRFHICHSCDNPSCVNPSHLSPGTPLKNNQEMIENGRHYRGG